jgi:hypothetical protein
MSSRLRDVDDPDHPPATVDDAIPFIIEALEDPLKPRWCASSIIASMVVIDHANHPIETLINANHLFGSTIVAFLTAKRSAKDIRTLVSRWSKCSCSYADITRQDKVEKIHVVVDSMAATLPKFIADLKFGEVRYLQRVVQKFAHYFEAAVTKVKPLSVAQGRHPKIWPASPKDLIPYGGQ